jgi:hypothetical protein
VSDQKLSVVEETPSYILLSNGDVLPRGTALWKQYTGQPPPRAPPEPSGPRKILRREFDEMDHPQRWEAVKSGAKIVDSLEVKPAPPAPRQPGLTIRRETFDKMTETEKWAAMRDVNAGEARIVD